MGKDINGPASAPVFRQLDHSSPSPAVPTLDASAFLANNDAYGYFSGLNQLVVTGPTLTNVNDFRAILIRQLNSKASTIGLRGPGDLR